MQPDELIQILALPEPSLKKLSFCSGSKVSRVTEWAGMLRPTQLSQTSAMLYRALPEVKQLKTSAQSRFEMLEVLRPYVQHTIFGLSKHFLHQPLSLREEAERSAVLAQALQKHMIDGYGLCIADLSKQKKLKPDERKILATSLHRAITGIGLMFMRCYQIYTHAPKGHWRQLHTLFRLADRHEMLDERVADDTQTHAKVSTLQSAYLTTVMLASARPHQMSQNEIRATHAIFGEWAELVKFSIDLSADPENFFYVNLEQDTGPQYKSRLSEDERDNLLIELNLKPLLGQLAKQTGQEAEVSASLNVPADITTSIIEHLLASWSHVAQRKQERRPIQATAEVCIGLSECHYQLCNGQDFETFVRSAAEPQDVEDASFGGFTPKDAFGDDSAGAEHSAHRIEVQNVSQGGYCLLWNSSSPLKVEAGELVGIKEFGKRVWQVGVVRWIRQKKAASQLGVQILSDRAQPYALAQTYDMGGYSDFMRGLFLPQSQFSSDPASLLTPSAPFQENDRVKVLDGERSQLAKLDEKLFSTSAMQQFSFHIIDSGNGPTPSPTGSKW